IRALAITGIVTASWMPAIISGSDMRATPPSLRMSDGTRSSAMTAAAPADSAILACSGVTTSMITPPLSISARPDLTRNVATSFIGFESSYGMGWLLGRTSADCSIDGGAAVGRPQLLADRRRQQLAADCRLQGRISDAWRFCLYGQSFPIARR